MLYDSQRLKLDGSVSELISDVSVGWMFPQLDGGTLFSLDGAVGGREGEISQIQHYKERFSH